MPAMSQPSNQHYESVYNLYQPHNPEPQQSNPQSGTMIPAGQKMPQGTQWEHAQLGEMYEPHLEGRNRLGNALPRFNQAVLLRMPQSANQTPGAFDPSTATPVPSTGFGNALMASMYQQPQYQHSILAQYGTPRPQMNNVSTPDLNTESDQVLMAQMYQQPQVQYGVLVQNGPPVQQNPGYQNQIPRRQPSQTTPSLSQIPSPNRLVQQNPGYQNQIPHLQPSQNMTSGYPQGQYHPASRAQYPAPAQINYQQNQGPRTTGQIRFREPPLGQNYIQGPPYQPTPNGMQQPQNFNPRFQGLGLMVQPRGYSSPGYQETRREIRESRITHPGNQEPPTVEQATFYQHHSRTGPAMEMSPQPRMEVRQPQMLSAGDQGSGMIMQDNRPRPQNPQAGPTFQQPMMSREQWGQPRPATSIQGPTSHDTPNTSSPCPPPQQVIPVEAHNQEGTNINLGSVNNTSPDVALKKRKQAAPAVSATAVGTASDLADNSSPALPTPTSMSPPSRRSLPAPPSPTPAVKTEKNLKLSETILSSRSIVYGDGSAEDQNLGEQLTLFNQAHDRSLPSQPLSPQPLSPQPLSSQPPPQQIQEHWHLQDRYPDYAAPPGFKRKMNEKEGKNPAKKQRM